MARVPGAGSVGQVGRATARAASVQRVVSDLDGLGEGLGVALQTFGQDFADMALEMRSQTFDDNKAQALNEVATALPERFDRDIERLQNEAQPGANGFSEASARTLEQTRQGFLTDLRDRYDLRPADFQEIERKTKALTAPKISTALRFEQDERRRHFGDQLTTQLESQALSVRRNPSPARVDLALTTARTAISNAESILTPEQAAEMQRNASRHIHMNALMGAVEQDPTGTLARLEAGEFDQLTEQGLSADDITRLTNAARTEHERVEAERERHAREQRSILRGQVVAGLEDDLASIRRTGKSAGQVSESQIRAAYADEPGKADSIIRQIDEEKAFYTTRQKVALTPLSEDLAILAANAPEGEGFAAEAARQDMLIKAAQEKRKALAEDPVGYLFQVSPAVSEAFQQAEAPEDLRSAMEAALDEQARIGLPRSARRVLSDGQANQLVATFAGQEDSQAKADWLRAQSEVYGDHWPRVYGEMVDAGLSPGAIVLAGMTRPGQNRAAVAMAEAMETGRKDIKASIGADAALEAEDAVRDALSSFEQTLASAPGGAGVGNLYHDQVSTLAMLYTLQGDNPSEAGHRAAAEVVNNHYRFYGTFRIPIEFKTGELALRAQAYKRNSLAGLDLELPFDAQLSQEDIKEQYISAIADKGYWLTNSDETSLILMNEQGATVMHRPFFNAPLEPVELLFSDLEAMPDPPAPPGPGLQPIRR